MSEEVEEMALPEMTDEECHKLAREKLFSVKLHGYHQKIVRMDDIEQGWEFVLGERYVACCE